MGNYSIKELEKLSGIKAHTIRIWEKRYRIITPQRTATNIRCYTDDDLKKIMNVSLLNHNGIKISQIARMSQEGISDKIFEISESKSEADIYVDQLVVAMVDMEEDQFEKILAGLIRKIGFERSITEVVYPFLEKIGILWQTSTITPAHEHFISNLIRQRIIYAVATLPIPSRKSRKVVLFLPEGELHEIGLLFFHYLTRKNGFKTYYLGQSVPHEDLKSVYRVHQPDILITSLVSSPSTNKVEDYIQLLSRDFPRATILASGLQIRNTAFRIPKNVKPFYKATELPVLLKSV
jgi:DNA-binding transcriptional MerR regulator